MSFAERAAIRIVNAIVADLNDRRGLGFDDVDDDIREEIRDKWRLLAKEAIEADE